MGRPKKWQRFSKEENKIIGTFRDVDLKWDDVQDTTSILGEISEKIFKSNTVYHRRRVFERILSLQKKSSHIVSSKITSRKGRRYKRPFWAKRDSYELDQEDQRKQHEVKHEGKGTLRSGIDCDETSDSQRNQTQHEFHGIPKSSDEKSRTANTDQPKSFEDSFKTFLRRKSKENDEEKHWAGDLNENEQPQKDDSEHNHESAREDQCKIPTEMTNKCTKMNATDSRQGYDENGDVNVRHRKKDAADKSLVKDQDDENNDKMHSTCYSNEQTNVCYSDDTIYDEDLVEEYDERFCFSAQKKEQKDRYSTDTSNVASAEQFETDEGIRERRMSLQSADESDIGYVYSKKDYAKDDSRFRDQQQDEKNEFTGNNKKRKEDGFSDSDFGASDKDFDIELKKGGKKGNDSGQMHGRGEYTYARVRNKNTKEESYTRAGKQNEKYFTADKKEVNNMYNTDSDKGVTDETKDVYSADKKMGKKRQNINGKDSVGSSDEINNSFVRAKRNYTNQKPMVRNQTNQHDKDKYGTADINERNGTCSDSDNDLGMNDDIDVKRKEVNKQQDFSFNISYSDEWKSIKPSRSESNKRKATLQHGWTDLLSKKFNEVIPGCVLAFRGHDLTAGIKSAYLSAVADCKHDDCGTFRFQIENKPKRNAENQVKVKVAIVRPYKPHTRETVKKRQLKGRRRRQMQEKLEREKASKLFYELLGQMELDQYRSGNDTECASKEVLKKAKSEWGLHDVLHQDPFTELCIVESILEDLDESSKHVSGYVQLICYKPFTTVLYTESSLEAAKEHIRVGGGVFNIDATGSVAYKVGQNKRRLLYYALVVNASAKFKDQVAVPVLEFFLEYQTTHNIANPLLMFFSALRKLTVFSQPVRIEVDFAWAIIHALLLSINLTSIIQYLSYCFRIVSGQCQPMSVTVIHICAAHMLKAFRDHIRDKVVDKGMRKFDIRVFALLQNITLLNESKQLWGLICTVLGSRTTTRHVQEKTITLQEMVKKASCDEMDIELTHSIGKTSKL